jgi:hypothetical protein
MKVYFLSFVGPDYSRSSVLLNFESASILKEYVAISHEWRRMYRELLILKKRMDHHSIIFVMSPSHKVCLPAKLITRQKVYLDAGWPLTDGVLSRGVKISKIPKLVKSFLLDFISFHSADLILVESKSQLQRVKRIFQVPSSRIKVAFTGFNERAFSELTRETPVVSNLDRKLKLLPNQVTVLFRGRINNESGIGTIIAAAEVLISEASFIIISDPSEELKTLPSNCFIVSNVTENEMSLLYERADIALGQISNHPRLSYTIPHKAFEAGYFAKCYVTPKSKGILELFSHESVFILDDASVECLVKAIRELKNFHLREKYENRIHKEYLRLASQKILNDDFEKLVNPLQL